MTSLTAATEFSQPALTANEEIVCISFNQDCSCVSVGTQEQVHVVRVAPFQRHNYTFHGGVGICEMLFGSSLLAVVGGGKNPAFSPRSLHIFDATSMRNICELNFNQPVRAVRLNASYLVAVLRSRIHIFDIDSMREIHRLDTPSNPQGRSL